MTTLFAVALLAAFADMRDELRYERERPAIEDWLARLHEAMA